jgi:hypothetical protein
MFSKQHEGDSYTLGITFHYIFSEKHIYMTILISNVTKFFELVTMPFMRRALPALEALGFAQQRAGYKDLHPHARTSENIEGTNLQSVVQGGKRDRVIQLRMRGKTDPSKYTSGQALYNKLFCEPIAEGSVEKKACISKVTGRFDPDAQVSEDDLIKEIAGLTKAKWDKAKTDLKIHPKLVAKVEKVRGGK